MGARSPPVSATEEAAPEGGTGTVWEEKQEANGVNLGKEGCAPLGAEVGEARLFREAGCSHSKGAWWGRRDVRVTTVSSAHCPLGSESGLVGSPFPIIGRAEGVYPVYLGSPSTGTLCSPPAPAGTHPQHQADRLCVQGTSGLMSLPVESRNKAPGG